MPNIIVNKILSTDTFHFEKCSFLMSGNNSALLHFRTPPPPDPILIDDSSWKNAAESFTVALTLTLGGTKVQ